MALDKAPTFTVTVLDVEVSIDRFALQSLARSHYCKQVIGNATLTARIHCTGIKFETTWIIRACTLLRDLQYPLHVKHAHRVCAHTKISRAHNRIQNSVSRMEFEYRIQQEVSAAGS